MSSCKSFATAATLALLASFGVSAQTLAAETDAGLEPVCASSTRVLFRSTGHPGKSAYKRENVRVPKRCPGVARNTLELASFVDGVGGPALMAGRAGRAIDEITAPRELKVSAAALTNLCVAHTVLRQWAQSRDACDAAVAAAVDEHARDKYWPGSYLRRPNKTLAVAYSNRAVLSWLSHDASAAADDLARARAIAPHAGFIVRNSELTALAPTQAQVRVLNGYSPVG